MKLVARGHQTMIWERTRHVLRLRSALREFFPAALTAFGDLDEPDTLALLAAAPDPDRAARLSTSKIAAALRRSNRRNVDARAVEIQAALRAPALRQPPAVQAAFAAIAAGEVRLIASLNSEVAALGEVVAEHFGRHRDAEIYISQPGLGVILGARVLAEFGDDPHRYADAKARKNYAGTSPITRASGTKKKVSARYAKNDRLADALQQWAFGSLRGSPGARLLRRTPSPQDRSPGRATPTRQPARRHPARLPEDPHPLQREHRLANPKQRRRLTSKNLGCLLRRVLAQSRPHAASSQTTSRPGNVRSVSTVTDATAGKRLVCPHQAKRAE